MLLNIFIKLFCSPVNMYFKKSYSLLILYWI